MWYRLALFPLVFAVLPMVAQIGRGVLADTATVTVRHGACRAALTGEFMQGLFQHEAMVVSKDGEQHTFRGPLLRNVVRAACPSVAEMDKRAMTASAVKVTADDGYVAIIAGMEMDSTFQARPVILATDRDGSPIDGHYGPFQLIVPDDLRHSRNVRNVRSIEVITP